MIVVALFFIENYKRNLIFLYDFFNFSGLCLYKLDKLKSIFTTLFICSFFFSIAQNNNSVWNTVSVSDDFEISTQKLNCSLPTTSISKEYLFIKIENKASSEIQLQYKIEKWYDGVCSNCENSGENAPFSVTLPSGQSVQGTCEDYRDRSLSIFSEMKGKIKARKLTNYKIIPLSVNGKKL